MVIEKLDREDQDYEVYELVEKMNEIIEYLNKSKKDGDVLLFLKYGLKGKSLTKEDIKILREEHYVASGPY